MFQEIKLIFIVYQYYLQRCIDKLIEREYLRRKAGEQNIYEYVA